MTDRSYHRNARRVWSATILATAVLAGACSSSSDSGDADDASGDARETAETAETAAEAGSELVAFEHSQGTTEVPAAPQRIVTTTDQNALLPLLELGVVPVGSAGLIGSNGSETFRRTEGFDTTGIAFVGSYGEANAEAIAALDPDLIVGYEFDDEAYPTLSQIAPTALIQIFDRPLDEALLDFAGLVGETDKAEALKAAYDERIDDLIASLDDHRDRLSVSVIYAGEPGQFQRADTGQALGTVMAALDVLRPQPQQGEPDFSEVFSLENLPDHDADVVIVIDYSGERQDPGLDALISSPLYDNLVASQAGQAFVIDGTQTVGAAWARMDRFLDDLESILLDPDLDVDVVDEGAGDGET